METVSRIKCLIFFAACSRLIYARLAYAEQRAVNEIILPYHGRYLTEILESLSKQLWSTSTSAQPCESCTQRKHIGPLFLQCLNRFQCIKLFLSPAWSDLSMLACGGYTGCNLLQQHTNCSQVIWLLRANVAAADIDSEEMLFVHNTPASPSLSVMCACEFIHSLFVASFINPFWSHLSSHYNPHHHHHPKNSTLNIKY